MSREPASAEATSADAEWARELTASWVETYKKSATTLALLRIVRAHGPVPAAEVAARLEEATGWSVTERGLYRTLRRLAEAQVLAVHRVDVARTGMKRQDFTLTSIGAAYLAGIEQAHARLAAAPAPAISPDAPPAPE
ncbi:helix-turn-helix transcriptional regulator [Brachybacterium phenoliresistens]|uniref:Uncharacterized protein n=1 Tax=Brachybacterium phenoliresistens TaxID=396014 RepID=Z9JUY3_9MICO|nr:helix-turn-helix transcriptional regulator [Brachybacterium phenoliresistens]EWS81586.1 hypothetical protein BF93_15525 [Brachybacterium phenoliresistens]